MNQAIIQPQVLNKMPIVASIGKTHRIRSRIRFLLRAFMMIFLEAFLYPVLRGWERLKWHRKVASVTLTNDPVFILGHWRSGTTFFHTLMAQDAQFGVMTNAKTFFPWFMEAGKKSVVRAVIARLIPEKRWDNVALTPDSPQEEEFAIDRLFGASAYTGWCRPARLRRFFEKYILLQFEDEANRTRFGQQYLYVLKKLTAICGDRQLLLKNPPNTGRISLLLKLFPNARFIYLSREPAEVYYSTIRMHEQLFARFATAASDNLGLPLFVSDFYTRLLDRYETEKTLIPPNNLIEVKYEQFIRHPEQTLENIYTALNLPGFSNALPAFRAFLETQKNFRPASYLLTPCERAVTNQLMKTGNSSSSHY
ncbi:MAG: sulfotransferase [Saprospiraceae bacterium]|nr:sulfotransferase [Saprospiraceae bacterium]